MTVQQSNLCLFSMFRKLFVGGLDWSTTQGKLIVLLFYG